jgi:hypothetical protein
VEPWSQSEVTNQQPDIGLPLMLHCHFLHVIRDFYTFKIGPEVVLAARWRPTAEMTSSFDSPTLICERLYLTVQNLFDSILIWLEV